MLVNSLHFQPISGNRFDDCTAILQCIGDTKTSPIELADGQQKAVLSAWWSLVQAFWKKFGPEPIRDEKVRTDLTLVATSNFTNV